MSDSITSFFYANEESLWCLVHEQVDDAMLREIAAADRGENSDAHLMVLREIVKGALPIPMGEIPKEVLELTSGYDPTTEREHWRLLFVCLTLLRASQRPHNEHFHGELTHVLSIVTSSLSLGGDCPRAARQFLVSCLLKRTSLDSLAPYLAVAILVLSVSLNDLTKTNIEYLIAVVESNPSEVWELFDRRYCPKSREWKALIRESLVLPPSLEEQIKNFGRYLLLEADLA